MKYNIVTVVVKRLNKGVYGKSFSYFAITGDGSQIPLRQKATQLYENAFYYEFPVMPGDGLVRHFVYGKKPPYPNVSKIYKIIEEQ